MRSRVDFIGYPAYSLFLAAMLTCSVAWAQSTATPANKNCHPDRGLSQVSSPRVKAAQTIDVYSLDQLGTGNKVRQCLTNVRWANAMLRKGDLIVVDIRPEKEFNLYNIPGSVNMPPFAVKTRTYWKDKKILLVNDGYSYRKLDSLCADLRKSGFNQVSVLDGGVTAWRKNIAPSRNAPPGGRLETITPARLLPEAAYRHWKVLDLTEEASRLGGDEKHLEVTRIEKSIQEKIRKLSSGKPADRASGLVLVVTGDGKAYPKLARTIDKYIQVPVFYLKGGVKAYRDFLNRQLAIWNRNPGKSGKLSPCDYL